MHFHEGKFQKLNNTLLYLRHGHKCTSSLFQACWDPGLERSYLFASLPSTVWTRRLPWVLAYSVCSIPTCQLRQMNALLWALSFKGFMGSFHSVSPITWFHYFRAMKLPINTGLLWKSNHLHPPPFSFLPSLSSIFTESILVSMVMTLEHTRGSLWTDCIRRWSFLGRLDQEGSSHPSGSNVLGLPS